MSTIAYFPIGSKVTISKAEKQPKRGCSFARIQELFYQTLNLISLRKTFPNIAAMQKAVVPKDSMLLKMECLPIVNIPVLYFANHPDITKAIFKPHRDGDLFVTDNDSPVSIFKLISGMLNEPDLTKDDLMFTCSQEKTSQFRTITQKLLSKNQIETFKPLIDEVVQETVREWREKWGFDLGEAVHRFTCAALCKVLLGLNDEAGELAGAMRTFFDFISATFLNQPIDPEKIHAAKETFFRMAERGLTEGNGIAQQIHQEQGLNLHEKKMLLFSLFFSGTDSAVSSLTYCILKCYQNGQSDMNVRKMMAEGLRMYPPVIGVSRIAREDLELKVTHEDQSVTWHIPRGAQLYPSQNLVARCPVLFPDQPDQFNPKRFAAVDSLVSLPWMPLGSGMHVCPGAALYDVIAETLITALISKGTLSTEFQGEPTQTGHFINKLVERIRVV